MYDADQWRRDWPGPTSDAWLGPRTGLQRFDIRAVVLLLATVLGPSDSPGADAPSAKSPQVVSSPMKDSLPSRDERTAMITEFQQQGQFADALKLLRDWLNISRDAQAGEASRKEESALLKELASLSEAALEAGDFATARAGRDEILSAWTRLQGADHWRVVSARLRLAEVNRWAELSEQDRARLVQAAAWNRDVERLGDLGEYEQALPLARDAYQIRDSLLGPKHPDTLESLSNLGWIERDLGHLAAAEQHLSTAIRLREETLGANHPDRAYSLNVLGWIYVNASDYRQAETAFRAGREILSHWRDERPEDWAMNLTNLSLVRREQGDLDEAEQLAQEAVELRRKLLGEQHSDTILSLNNLADILQKRGDYVAAERSCREILRLNAAAGQGRSRSQGYYLGNLAFVLQAVGDYAESERIQQQALELRKSVLGPRHEDVAWSLWNLGRLSIAQGNYALAEERLTEALSIRQEKLGRDHVDTADLLQSLAAVALLRHEYAQAESLAREALETYSNRFGPNNQYRARCLYSLGAIRQAVGDLPGAQQFLEQSLDAFQKTCGAAHPETVDCLSALAVVHWLAGDRRTAEAQLGEALRLSAAHVRATSVALTERQQLALLEQQRHHLDAYLSCVLERPDGGAEAYQPVFEWKGAALIRQRAARRLVDQPELAPLFTELQAVTRQWSQLAQRAADPQQGEERRRQVQVLAERKEALEADLSQRSALYREAMQPPQYRDLLAALPANSVLVDFLEFDRLKPAPGNSGPVESIRSLLAFVVRAGETPRMFDLGPTAPINLAVDGWRKSFGLDQAQPAAGQTLRRTLWEPLLESLEGADLVLVSPDGTLGRFPLAALPGARPGTYLLEDHRLAIVTVPQLIPLLLSGGEPPGVPGKAMKDLLLMGDIDYDHRVAAATGGTGDGRRRRSRFENETETRSAAAGAVWARLQGAAAEVAYIKDLYQRLYEVPGDAIVDRRDSLATEEAFREFAPQCRLLHVATHGFFAKPERISALAAGQRSDAEHEQAAATRYQTVRGFSPGLLSGLVFAGANDPPELPSDPSQSDRVPDDGILTADEIAFLPLGGVRLVVLSACETGLGEVAGGEGVLGLQRSFQIAGARSTVTSLWQVDDLVTRRLMEEFYRNYLDRERPAVDALREAQLWLLQNPQQLRGDQRVRPAQAAEPERTPPFYWAAFQLSGDWR